MKLFGVDLTEHEPKRLGGMLVMMEHERHDGNDLCELLLDTPSRELKGNPLRCASDNRTWYNFMGGSGANEFIAAFGRLMDDRLSKPDYVPIATVYKLLLKQGRCEASLEQLRVEQYDYDGKPGYYAWIWELSPVEHSQIVICRGCGATYDFASRSGMITDTDVLDFLPQLGSKIDWDPSIGKRPKPDLFNTVVPPERRGVPQEVLEWLRAGNYRRWCCENCRREQGYPASLYLTSPSQA